MVDVLISTIYEKNDSTKFSIRDFNIHKIFLLIDKETKDKQLKSMELIKKAFSGVIEIIEKKVELYDVLSVSKDVIKIIDSTSRSDNIYVDISQGRKTQALGVLFACYARSERIKKIVYWGEDKRMITLPKLSFNLNGDNKKILNKIEDSKNMRILSNNLRMSRAKLYRQIKILEKKGLIIKNKDKFQLTDAGKIAML